MKSTRYGWPRQVSLLVLGAICLLNGPAQSQDCIEYGIHPFWLNELDTPGTAMAIEQYGDHLLVADGEAGLQIIRAVNPDNPELAYTMPIPGGAVDITVSGDHAYVASGEAGFHVLDISDPEAPVLVSTQATVGPATGIIIQDTLALVAAYDFGMQIFDITDPSIPVLLGTLESLGLAHAVAADEYFAFLADGTRGLQIIDITDPGSPEIVKTVNTPGNAKNVAVDEWTLYVADGNGGMSVCTRAPVYTEEARWEFDINSRDSSYRQFDDPDRTPLHHATLAGQAHIDSYTFENQTDWGLVTKDSLDFASFAPPIDPIYIGKLLFRFKVDTLFTSDPAFADPLTLISSGSPEWASGDFRVILDPADGTLVFSQEDPVTESHLDLRSGLDIWEKDQWYDVEIFWSDLGRDLKVTWHDGQNLLTDVRNDDVLASCFSLDVTESLIGSRTEFSPPTGLMIDRMKVFKSLPWGSVEETVLLPGYAQDLVLRDDHAFVAMGYGDLQIIDLTPVNGPEIVGTVDTPEHLESLVITPLHIMAVDKNAGLQVLRAAAPESPQPQWSIDTPGPAYGVEIGGNLAYVADRNNGLQIIDFATAAFPIFLGQAETSGPAMDVAVSGSYAYVAEAVFSKAADKAVLTRAVFPKDLFPAAGDKADGFTGLQIFDVTDPTIPVVIGTVETPGYPLDVEVSGGFTYVADFESFVVIDSSLPSNPVVSASLVTPGRPRDLAIQGNMAYVADLVGLQVIDITDPAAPQLVSSTNTTGSAYGVAVLGSLAFVANVESGLQVFDVSGMPQLIGSVFIPGGAYDVQVRGNYAYVAGGFDPQFSSLHIVDVTTHFAPQLVGCIDTPGSVYDIALEGPNVHLTDGGAGLQAFNFQCDPGTAPQLESDFSLTREDFGVNFTWKPEPGPETATFRLTGAKGDEIWEIPFTFDSEGVFFASDPAVAEHFGATVVYCLYRQQPGDLWEIVATEEVYFEAPRIITRLVGAHPNPFNPHTTVSFDVGNRQRVKIMVFDLSGRLVSSLVDREFQTGHHTAAWNGKNGSGGDVSSGIYFLRMETEESTAVKKITLVR